MNYNELRELCKTAKISMSDLAVELEMSLDGLKLAFDRQSLPMRLVVPICEKFAISPNKFFGVEGQHGDVVYGGQNKNGRKQIINSGSQEIVQVLREQLAAKDAEIEKVRTDLKETIQMLRDQLDAKDVQINQHLSIIAAK